MSRRRETGEDGQEPRFRIGLLGAAWAMTGGDAGGVWGALHAGGTVCAETLGCTVCLGSRPGDWRGETGAA